MLELLGFVDEVVGVSLGDEPALIRLLNEILVSLLLRKHDRILLRLEVQVGTLHAISRRLPAHQRVFPAVSSAKDIPVHSPVVSVPGTRLRRGLGGTVDPRGGSATGEEENGGTEGTYRTVRA